MLDSASEFDPFADEDRLTIHEPSLGEEPNLPASADRWTVEVNPLWLGRFLPDVLRDPSPDSPEGPHFEAEPHSTAGELQACRDTIVVGYGEMTRERGSLSFQVTGDPSRP